MPGPFLVILATLSAPSIASATMCSMCRCGVTCSENVRDACRTPPDAPLRPDAKRAFPLLPRTPASRFGKISSPAAAPHSDYPLSFKLWSGVQYCVALSSKTRHPYSQST